MREFLIPVGIGVAAALVLNGIWVLVLCAFGLARFGGTEEEKARLKERIRAMGKTRYVIVFGVLGWGLPLGFGIEMSHVTAHNYQGWGGIAISIVIFGLAGCWWGVRMWNDSYRGEVPFPPPWLSQK